MRARLLGAKVKSDWETWNTRAFPIVEKIHSCFDNRLQGIRLRDNSPSDGAVEDQPHDRLLGAV